jgi:hypothetical protein
LDIPHIQEGSGRDEKGIGPRAFDAIKGGFDLTTVTEPK